MENTIMFNGEKYMLKRPTTVAQLLEKLEVPTAGVVVERNREILHTEAFNRIVLQEGDELELIRIVGGG